MDKNQLLATKYITKLERKDKNREENDNEYQ